MHRISVALLGIILLFAEVCPASPSTSEWSSTIQANDLPTLATKLAVPNSGWPAIPSAVIDHNTPKQLAVDLYSKIEQFEWQRQSVKPDEATVIKMYASLSQSLRASGGYYNQLTAETAYRLALFRLIRWVMDDPSRATGAKALLNELRAPLLNVDLLNSLVMEQGKLPQRMDGQPIRFPASRPAGDTTLTAADMALADAVLSGLPYGVHISGDLTPYRRTRRLLDKVDVRYLLQRFDETDQLGTEVVPALLTFFIKGGEMRFLSNYDWMATNVFQDLVKDAAPRKPNPRYSSLPMGVVQNDLQDLYHTVMPWPVTPRYLYLTAVDSAPSTVSFKGPKTALSLKEEPIGEWPASPNLFPSMLGQTLAINPANGRWAYIENHDGAACIVINGKRSARSWQNLAMLNAGADGRFYYVATDAQGSRVVVDDTPGPVGKPIGGNVSPVRISADGKHYAYYHQRTDGAYVVTDGADHGPFEGLTALQISPDGLHWAATEKDFKTKSSSLIFDGKAATITGEPSQLTFSPDSKRLAYLRTTDKTAQAVIIGEGAGTFPNHVGNLQFTPDSKHILSVPERGACAALVVDGNVFKQFNQISSFDLAFSGDCQRIVYGGSVFSIDGKELQTYDEQTTFIIPGAASGKETRGQVQGAPGTSMVKFTLPDGRTLAPINYGGGKIALPDGRFVFVARGEMPVRSGIVPTKFVVDDVATPEFDGFGGIAYSSDGKNIVITGGRNGVWRINLNGVDSTATYDDIFAGITFMSSDHFRVIARRGSNMLLVDGTITPP